MEGYFLGGSVGKENSGRVIDLEPANVESGNWKKSSQFGNAGFYNSK